MTNNRAPIVYRSDGSSFLVIVSIDTDFVVSAYLEHGACSDWHFGYNRREQEVIEKLIPSCRYGRIVVWDQPVDPESDGWHPVQDLEFAADGHVGYALLTMSADRQTDGASYKHLLTINPDADPRSPVRLRGDLYPTDPMVPVSKLWNVAIEYMRMAQVPTSVDWQERYGQVPRGPFGKQLVPDNELPPELGFTSLLR
jgi:hypothetical protein